MGEEDQSGPKEKCQLSTIIYHLQAREGSSVFLVEHMSDCCIMLCRTPKSMATLIPSFLPFQNSENVFKVLCW